ncbi:MAG: glycogen synthase, partial [Planctomycetota bacterium]
PGSDVPVWLIDQPQYFDREGLYNSAGQDYPDNAERFTFFSHAAIQLMRRLEKPIDVVHCNDWQTGLVPALLKIFPWESSESSGEHRITPKTVMTIHNMAYQGVFPKSTFEMIGVGWEHFRSDEFEFYDQVNYLKVGLAMADQVTTVSPSYSHEIRTPQQGCGLDGLLNAKGDDRVTGIINGIDTEIWNPSTDPHLTRNYSVDSWRTGKEANKMSLQADFGLTIKADIPVLGLVGRLASQKGWDLILPVLRQHLEEQRPTQWMILGSGDPAIEAELTQLHQRFPGQLGLHVGFSNALAHRIEAASDFFVMPSHYEPCGLNQLYSLRYGTVPIVTPTGGLADTVVHCNPESIASGTATGFHLDQPTSVSLEQTINQALRMMYHDRVAFDAMVTTGMRQDWSWQQSAAHYVDLYESLVGAVIAPN